MFPTWRRRLLALLVCLPVACGTDTPSQRQHDVADPPLTPKPGLLPVPARKVLPTPAHAESVDRPRDTSITLQPAGRASTITEIIDAAGDGAGNGLDAPISVAVDAAGNAYVTGWDTRNAFKITQVAPADCNSNGIDDATDIAAGTSSDCNSNGSPDECEISSLVFAASPQFSPVGTGLTQLLVTPSPLPAVGPVTLTFTARAALHGTNRWMFVSINNTGVGQIFQNNGTFCPQTPDVDQFTISANKFNTAVGGGDASISVVPTADIPPAACGGPRSFLTFTIQYLGRSLADCNANDLIDVCEIAAGSAADCNSNEIPDHCDVMNDPGRDCNANGIPDICDIVDGTSVDCDSNSVPDECEPDCNNNGIADVCDISRGTSADCETNGVPDECDVVAEPWRDCNTNRVPDECDVAHGTSEDCQSNGTPDECDVVAVRVIWADQLRGEIRSALFDGTDVQTLISGIENPRGIAVDNSAGKMYWTDDGDSGAIRRANCNGTARETIRTRLSATQDVELDVGRGHVFWCNDAMHSIQRMDLGDRNVVTLVRALTKPTGLALDVESGKMYWSDWGAFKMQRANMDGTVVEDLITTGITNVYDVALDAAAGKMYFTASPQGEIRRANLDGTNMETVVSGLGNLRGLALDLRQSKVYWADASGTKIQRANLDGTGVEDLVTTRVSGPRFLALLPARPGDCNTNGVPDDCDVAAGTSLDCNSNGVPDECDIAGGTSADINGDGRPDECVIPLALDIRPGSCPNPLNRNSHGVLPVALAGAKDFDVSTVVVATIRLSRADGVGGWVSPAGGPRGPRIELTDTATPFGGEPCDCHELAGDGIIDLSMKFDVHDVVAALQMNDLPSGDPVELEVRGSLLEGINFSAGDCVKLVPPGAGSALLRVQARTSQPFDSWVELSPPDLTQDGGGAGDSTRAYLDGTVVTLTALPLSDHEFAYWLVDGVMRPHGQTTIQVTVQPGTQTVEAVYLPTLEMQPIRSVPTGPR